MKILHTMLRVGDLEKSIDFYVNRQVLSWKNYLLLKKHDISRKWWMNIINYYDASERPISMGVFKSNEIYNKKYLA